MRVALDQPGVCARDGSWIAVGMADTDSVEVTFENVRGRIVGASGDCVKRPGFWHRATGVAACWRGAATCLGRLVRHHAPPKLGPEQAAGFGRVDNALHEGANALRAAAAWIDAHPRTDARGLAMRTRNTVERSSLAVLDHAGHVLGAVAFCVNPIFARMAADLPVYVRQNHLDQSFRLLGEAAIDAEPAGWML